MTKGRAADPNEGLAADAVLAEDLGDEEERRLNQIAEMGGTIDEDIDNWDPSKEDRGDDPAAKTPDDKDDDKGDDAQSGDDDTQSGDDDKDKDDDSDKDKDGDKAGDKDGDDDGKDDKEGSEDDKDGEADKDKDDADADADADDKTPAEESDEGDEPSGEDKADKGKGKPGIPKHRFDEVNERRKTAEAENVTLKAQIEASKPPAEKEKPYDFRENEKAYMEFLLDGKTEEALSKREEIDAARKADWKAETKAETHGEVDVAAAKRDLDIMSKEAEKLYPVFDEDHEDFNPDLPDKVMVYYQGYIQTGAAKTPSDAFVMALADVVDQYNLEDKYHALDDDPKPDLKPDPKPKPKDKVDKTKEATAKKAHTPVTGEGSAADDAGAIAPDVEGMTDEELDALPAKTLSRMRGDFIS